MLKTFRTHRVIPHLVILIVALGGAGPALAQTDPTLRQIYEAAETGHLDQAQQMMNQVLRNHPQSAKAHYVAAELYARQGNFPSARQQLSAAETLDPGLVFAKPDSVQRLKRQLAQGQAVRAAPGPALTQGRTESPSSIPWGLILIVGAGVAIVFAVMRRRAATPAYNQYPAGAPAAGGPGYGPGAGPGYGPGAGPGIGSGLAGGLATGLAVGAGVVAGEALAHQFIGGGRHEGATPPPGDANQFPANGDMGGSDFGVNDAGSWDDGGSVGGDVGGGDDWT